MKRMLIILLGILLWFLPSVCRAQTVKNASYQTVGHIKSDGTIQDASYKTIGHIKSDGTVQDECYRTVGHTDGIPMQWAAFFFFFHK